MSKLNTSRYCWSWRSCFTTEKFNKKQTKKKHSSQSNLRSLPINEQTLDKCLQAVDENFNLLKDFDSTCNEYNHQVIPNDYMLNYETTSDTIENNQLEETVEDVNRQLINSKLTVRPTQLDAIAEDLNEENCDEVYDKIEPNKLYSDRELINESNELYNRLFDLSKMTHVINQFNKSGYLFGEFTRHIEKFQWTIDDVERATMAMPRDAELLEARYSTLLATIENLSLLLKFAQLFSYDPLINRLISSIENRIEQLNKIVQLSSSMYLRQQQQQQQQDLNEEDFLSFRSALSSYEHLLTISS